MNVDAASSRESFPTNSAKIEARKLKVDRIKENVNNGSETKNKLVKTPVKQKKRCQGKRKSVYLVIKSTGEEKDYKYI